VANGDNHTVVARVRTGPCALGAATDPRAGTAYVTNACGNTVSVLAVRRG
jgi:DNA-binding beta-propeller fold protein YncE